MQVGHPHTHAYIKKKKKKYNEKLSRMGSLIVHYGMDDSRKGDYYRYLAEFKTDQDRKEAADQSLKGYEA